MTAQAVRAARPGLTPGSQVTATYTLRQRLGRNTLEFGRAVTGTLKGVRWLSPTAFEATIDVGGLDWQIDSRIADSIEPA